MQVWTQTSWHVTLCICSVCNKSAFKTLLDRNDMIPVCCGSCSSFLSSLTFHFEQNIPGWTEKKAAIKKIITPPIWLFSSVLVDLFILFSSMHVISSVFNVLYVHMYVTVCHFQPCVLPRVSVHSKHMLAVPLQRNSGPAHGCDSTS